MNNRVYMIFSFVVGVVVWFLDASINYLVYEKSEFDFIPDNKYEFLARTVIVSFIIFSGWKIDVFVRKAVIEEKRLEAIRIYESMVDATHHILNNFLHKTPLFMIEAKQCKDFNPKYIESFDQAITQASELIKRLSEIECITDDNIQTSIYPKYDKK